MKFTDIFKRASNPQQDEGYLSLTLTPHKLLVTIWNLENENVRIRSYEERTFTTTENLIHQAAVAIDTAAQKANMDIEKVVFGLSQVWFEGDDVSPKTSKLLKNLSDDLELVPQAFVSLASAVNHFLKIDEGITPQAVVIGIFQETDESFCETHLIKNNKVVSTKTSTFPLNIKNLTQLIGELKGEEESLPSRIIIYGDPRDELLNEIKDAKFENIFIHEPKIETLESNKLSTSVSYAQAADILGHEPSLESKNPDEQKAAEIPEEKTNDLGFVANIDVLEGKTRAKKDENQEEKIPEELSKQTLNHKITKGEQYAVDFSDDLGAAKEKLKQSKILPKFKIPSLFKLFSLPKASIKFAIILGIFLLIPIIGLFIAGQTFTSAHVTVKVIAKSQDGNFTAKVVPQGSFDTGLFQIPGVILASSAQGNKKDVATGTKKIGNEAKGSVNFRNWDKEAKSFKAQTEIITSNGLKFSLDNDIEVPPRTDTPGITKADVTAVDVGSIYNVSANTDFTIVGFDSTFYDAKAQDPGFSGGDEKEVTVVSQNDLDKLKKSLTDSLIQKAKDELKAKSQGTIFSDAALVEKTLRQDFDKKVDEEASFINVDMEIEVNVIAYDEKDLKKLISETSQNQDNFELRPEDTETFDIIAKRSKDTLNISGKYRAKLIPKFNKDTLGSQIAGKSVKETRAVIKQASEVTDVIVTFSPAFPFVDSLPKDKSKINFKIEIS